MSRKNIYITAFCLCLSFLTYGQLTLEGVNVTLKGNTNVFSSGDINVYNTSDTSILSVEIGSELVATAVFDNKGYLYNNGKVSVKDFENTSDTAVVVNYGDIFVKGDLDVEDGYYTGLGLSSVVFTGGGKHFVRSTDDNRFRRLVVDDGDVVMETDFLAQNVEFNNDKIVCNGNRLGVLDSIKGYNSNSYVEGLLARVVRNGDYIMPIGASSYYRPAKITGVTDSTVVFMEVYGGAFDLDEFGELKGVDEELVWEYETDSTVYANMASPFKIGLAYDVSDFSDIGTTVANHRVAISDLDQNGFESYGGTSGGMIASGLTTLYSTLGIPHEGYISIGEVCSLNEFAVSALLEGPYDGTSGEMNSSLTTQLKTQYEYGGNASVNMRSGYTVPSNAVDVVRVVLRDGTNFSRLDTAYAWLMKDGGMKDFETGQNPKLGFCDVTSSNFYIQVEHRNHLPIMSSSTYSKVGTVTSVDMTDVSNIYGIGFTTGYNSVTYSNEALMYSGDSRKSPANVVNALDYFEIINVMNSLPTGYLRTDLNLSGGIEAGDNDLGLDNSSWLRKSTVR